MTTVTATILFEAVHCWPGCNLPQVAFLKSPHRHVFHIACEMPVTHSDRDTEFICLKKQVADYLEAKFPDRDMGSTSCEMLAEDLLHIFSLSKCSVFEDGENGATVYAEPAVAKVGKPEVETYNDPSEKSRTRWVGLEVEGRLKGLRTSFLTTLVEVAGMPDEPHIFLCPTIAQNDDPAAVERLVHTAVGLGKLVTVAVKPKDLHKLTALVRVEAHIMVDIDLHGAEWLKPSDTIKVETSPYTTLATSVEQMVATHPQDYARDI